ncbi:MAG: hypothetical protein ACOH5I_00840 [Oligoflexus sp.]
MIKAFVLFSSLSFFLVSCGSDDDNQLSSNVDGNSSNSACLALQSEAASLVVSAHWTVSECGSLGEELVYYRCEEDTRVEYDRVSTGQFCS